MPICFSIPAIKRTFNTYPIQIKHLSIDTNVIISANFSSENRRQYLFIFIILNFYRTILK